MCTGEKQQGQNSFFEKINKIDNRWIDWPRKKEKTQSTNIRTQKENILQVDSKNNKRILRTNIYVKYLTYFIFLAKSNLPKVT